MIKAQLLTDDRFVYFWKCDSLTQGRYFGHKKNIFIPERLLEIDVQAWLLDDIVKKVLSLQQYEQQYGECHWKFVAGRNVSRWLN